MEGSTAPWHSEPPALLEVVVWEVSEDFPDPSPEETLDADPRTTAPDVLLRAAAGKKRRNNSASAQGADGHVAASSAGAASCDRGLAEVALPVYAQGWRCEVPACLLAKAGSAGRGPPAPAPGARRWELRLRCARRLLSKETPFVTAAAVAQCLEAATSAHRGAVDAVEVPAALSALHTVRFLAAALLLGLDRAADAARSRLLGLLSAKSLRSATAAALAWGDAELLRHCYAALCGALCQPPGPGPGPGKLGVGADAFEHHGLSWPLAAFAPAAQAIAESRQAAAAAPPPGRCVACRLQRAGRGLRLVCEGGPAGGWELLRVTFGTAAAVLHAGGDSGCDARGQHQQGLGVPGLPPGQALLHGERCCGVLEVGLLARSFTLRRGAELLPAWPSERAREIRERMPHAPPEWRGTVSWDASSLLGGERGHLTLEAPGLPALRGRTSGGRGGGCAAELAPRGCEEGTPWLAVGAADAAGERLLLWRHPVGADLALSVALAVCHPWDSGGG